MLLIQWTHGLSSLVERLDCEAEFKNLWSLPPLLTRIHCQLIKYIDECTTLTSYNNPKGQCHCTHSYLTILLHMTSAEFTFLQPIL
jgi:hypothetical protein